MAPDKRNPEVGASGLNEGASFPSRNDHEIIAQPSPEAQAVSRDLLRDAVYDGAADAISYLEGIRVFTACDDVPALRYSTSKFVSFAREIIHGSRKLTGDKTGDAPTDERLGAERLAALRPAGRAGQ
jgi:hypothetical protein